MKKFYCAKSKTQSMTPIVYEVNYTLRACLVNHFVRYQPFYFNPDLFDQVNLKQKAKDFGFEKKWFKRLKKGGN